MCVHPHSFVAPDKLVTFNLLDLLNELPQSHVDVYGFRMDPLATERTAEHRVLWLGSSRSEEAFEAWPAERVSARRGHRHSRVAIKLQETDWTLTGRQIVHSLIQTQVLQER